MCHKHYLLIIKWFSIVTFGRGFAPNPCRPCEGHAEAGRPISCCRLDAKNETRKIKLACRSFSEGRTKRTPGWSRHDLYRHTELLSKYVWPTHGACWQVLPVRLTQQYHNIIDDYVNISEHTDPLKLLKRWVLIQHA
jgi:hypothetical protein